MFCSEFKKKKKCSVQTRIKAKNRGPFQPIFYDLKELNNSILINSCVEERRKKSHWTAIYFI